jgi:hypothetical protein
MFARQSDVHAEYQALRRTGSYTMRYRYNRMVLVSYILPSADQRRGNSEEDDSAERKDQGFQRFVNAGILNMPWSWH